MYLHLINYNLLEEQRKKYVLLLLEVDLLINENYNKQTIYSKIKINFVKIEVIIYTSAP